MQTYTSEEQEIEAVKKWWAENGLAIGLGIVIGLGGLFGWRGYQSYQAEQATAASNIYESMLIGARSDDVDTLETTGQQIISDYDGTEYATFSALILARQAVEDGDMATARQQLQYARDRAGDAGLRSLATLRLARVAFAEDKTAETLGLLANDIEGYPAAVAELKGDVYVQQGELDKAREEYALALSRLSPGSGPHGIVQMKLDSVGSSGE